MKFRIVYDVVEETYHLQRKLWNILWLPIDHTGSFAFAFTYRSKERAQDNLDRLIAEAAVRKAVGRYVYSDEVEVDV